MSAKKEASNSRAIVLGGGGVTGIAWEIGILAGLLEAGIDLQKADRIIGTSAGAFVGTALSAGYDMHQLFEQQSQSNAFELSASASEALIGEWINAFSIGGSDPQRVGAAFGEIAKKNPEPVPVIERRSAVMARLVTTDWPERLQVTAIEADTGQLHVFDRSSGISLIDAVSASGAVPGLWPGVQMKGKLWIDGGMVSTTNARLASGCERIIILAPMPDGHGLIPGAREDTAELSANAEVVLITPDEASIQAIGPNRYDPERKSAVAAAGKAQGKNIASAVQSMW
ncbi:patatin-like phospholipase family protein [Paenibacillus terreus]|uniref:Patatin-like phospholipase family protein n=1 Tax=Paenibacillus terreus TaxID=1387834 RepID=A0ABV5BAB3_9BACL